MLSMGHISIQNDIIRQTHNPIWKFAIISRAAWSWENGREHGLVLLLKPGAHKPAKNCLLMAWQGSGVKGDSCQVPILCPLQRSTTEQVPGGHITEAPRTIHSPHAVGTRLLG